MRRVLIIAPNWIGDALMSQSLFILLKERYPKLIIDVIANISVAPLFEKMPQINHVYTHYFKRRSLELISRFQLSRTIAEQHYEAAYILPNSFKTALIPWLAGIRLRIGYRGEARLGLINVTHKNPAKKNRPAMLKHYAALAYAPRSPLPKKLPYPQLDVDVNEAFFTSRHFSLDTRVPLIVFCPGAEYGPAKRWPAKHFSALANFLRQSFPYAQIIALGSKKDHTFSEEIIKEAPQVRNMCGETSLKEACALIARAVLVVTNDSGLMHISAALNRPLIALYGSTDPHHTPPLSTTARIQWLKLECSPCFERECPLGHLNCLNQLLPEAVFNEARELLKA